MINNITFLKAIKNGQSRDTINNGIRHRTLTNKTKLTQHGKLKRGYTKNLLSLKNVATSEPKASYLIFELEGIIHS
jgi:hypothetical protein